MQCKKTMRLSISRTGSTARKRVRSGFRIGGCSQRWREVNPCRVCSRGLACPALAGSDIHGFLIRIPLQRQTPRPQTLTSCTPVPQPVMSVNHSILSHGILSRCMSGASRLYIYDLSHDILNRSMSYYALQSYQPIFRMDQPFLRV